MSIGAGDILAGRYRIERLLREGMTGRVFGATSLPHERRVAIKLPPEGADEIGRKRLMREAQILAMLRGKHAVQVYDFGTAEDGTPFIVMEHLEGYDLEQRLQDGGPLPIAETVTYVLQACETIAEAHAMGVIHRDIRPANLFLVRAPDGKATVKLLDFGIAMVQIPQDDRVARAFNAQLGLRPSAGGVDGRGDIWSLGVTLYQLLTGRLPFEGSSPEELALKISTGDPAPPRAHRPELPEELEAVILRCLRREREERFSSVHELVQALAPFAGRA